MTNPLEKDLEKSLLYGTKLADMSGAELALIVETVISQFGVNDQLRRAGSLTLPEFAAMMVDLQQTKQFIQASKEQAVMNEVFRNVNHLRGATMPFVLRTEEDIDKFTKDLKESISKNSEFVVAVAVRQV